MTGNFHPTTACANRSEPEMDEIRETREGRPLDSSPSLSSRPAATENVASSVNNGGSSQGAEPGIEGRLAAIERFLTSHQEMLQRLISVSEPPPPPAPTPGEIYENAREQAEFVDYHQWDSLYIHGLVRIGGKRSRPVTQDPPCELCAAHNRVCIVLPEDDPYREFLFVERKVCCGWCEYDTIPNERMQRNQEMVAITHPTDSGSPSRLTEHQRREQNQVKSTGLREQENARKMTTFFVLGDGIDQDVITTDTSRYLGNDAVVRLGTYQVRLLRCKLLILLLIAA